MTLIEIIIVIVLIGGIIAVVGSKIIGNKARADYNLTKVQLQTLTQQINQYQQDVGTLPDSLDNLVTAPTNATGWLGPYAKTNELKDPWKNAIDYRRPGDNAPYELISMGADGKTGGEGVDKDLVVQP